MNRRQYLRSGAGAATVALLAGCLDDFGLDEHDSSDPAEDRTGVRELDRAAGKLNEAALALDIEEDIDDPAAVEFDPEEPDELIEAARDHLETAAAELGENRQADVETLRTYADVLEGLVVVTETIADEDLENDIETVSGAIDEDADLSAAADVLEDRRTDLDGALQRHDDVVEQFQSLDDERFEELARIDRAELEDGIGELGNVLDSLETLVSGFESMVAGYEDLERGREYSDDEEYERAEGAFTDAESAFETASSTLETETKAPDGLAQHFETARCQSEHLIDAAAAFADAAAAAADRDPVTADERQRDGERALEDARNCAE